MRRFLCHNWTIERLFALGFIGLSFIAAPSAYFVMQGFKEAQANRATGDQANVVSDEARTAFAALQAALTSSQAFAITGDTAVLAAYQRALAALATATTQLHGLVAGHARQQQRSERLDALITEQRRNLDAIVAPRPVTGAPVVAAIAATKSSSELTDAIRDTVDDIVNANQRRIAAIDAAVARRVASNRLIIESSFISAALATLLGGLLVIRYVVRLRKTDIELADQTALLRITLESIDQGVIAVDRNLTIQAWNDRFFVLNDYPRELVYRGVSFVEFLRIVYLADRGQFGTADAEIAEIVTQIRSGAVHRFERQQPNGTVIEICRNFAPDGLMVTTFRDITARKKSERELQNSATRLHAIFDNAIDAILTVGAGDTIESFNAAAEQLFGYRADEAVHGDVKPMMPALFQSIREGPTGSRSEIVVHRRDGTAVPVEASISEITLAGDRLFVAILRDVSERKEIDRTKTEFITTVSHELRTPLTSIVGSLGLLAASAAGDLPETPRRLIEIAHTNCERLARLVNDILDLEKIESGQMEFKFQPVRLRPLVENCIEANRAYAERLAVAFVLDPRADNGIVAADPDRFVQVVTNLLSNAAKFSSAGGTVEINLVRRPHTLRLSVLDHGRGIEPAFRDRVFEKFAQAEHSNNRGPGSTGLGLAICRQIVERHGGRISFDSVFGEWAVFYVDLPLHHAETESDPAKASAAGPIHPDAAVREGAELFEHESC